MLPWEAFHTINNMALKEEHSIPHKELFKFSVGDAALYPKE
jgi:hypothetical protein